MAFTKLINKCILQKKQQQHRQIHMNEEKYVDPNKCIAQISCVRNVSGCSRKSFKELNEKNEYSHLRNCIADFVFIFIYKSKFVADANERLS